MRSPRPVRVSAPAIEVWLGAEFGRLVDISATGALVRTTSPLSAGRECPLILNTPREPARLTVRVVWAEPLLPETSEAPLPRKDYLVGVRFTELPPMAKQVVSGLCGPAFSRRE
ncbi:MAG: PilZ domain-containing protein [Acidobacteria bacterium]|nr:PilZ domain-containing protein [Acidobacteriota bacterium]